MKRSLFVMSLFLILTLLAACGGTLPAGDSDGKSNAPASGNTGDDLITIVTRESNQQPPLECMRSVDGIERCRFLASDSTTQPMVIEGRAADCSHDYKTGDCNDTVSSGPASTGGARPAASCAPDKPCIDTRVYPQPMPIRCAQTADGSEKCDAVKSPEYTYPGYGIATGECPPEISARPCGSMAAQAVIAGLSKRLGIDHTLIKLVKQMYVEWPNSCLGDNQKERACLMVITPGYVLGLYANNDYYVYHTNLDGTAYISIESRIVMPEPMPMPLPYPEPVAYEGYAEYCKTDVVDKSRICANAAIDAARSHLANHLVIDRGAVNYVKGKRVEWPDPSLGVPDPLARYAQIITPGYHLVFDVKGSYYEYHTTLNGDRVVMAGGYAGGGGSTGIIEPMPPVDVQPLPAPRVPQITCDYGAPAYKCDNKAVQAAMYHLAKSENVNAQSILLVKWATVTWPNGCLGVEKRDTLCTMALVDGYVLVFQLNTNTYIEYHTNGDGSQVVRAN